MIRPFTFLHHPDLSRRRRRRCCCHPPGVEIVTNDRTQTANEVQYSLLHGGGWKRVVEIEGQDESVDL